MVDLNPNLIPSRRFCTGGRGSLISAHMKNASRVAALALVGSLITGCGDSSKTPPPPTQTGNASASTASEEVTKAATQVAKDVATEAKKQASEAVTEVTKQATAIAADAQKQANAAYQNLSSQLVSSLQPSPDSQIKSISSDLGNKVAKLGESLQSNEPVKGQLESALQSLLGKKDADAVGTLGKITESKLTPEQTTLAKDVYNAAAALVTQRNFSGLEGMNTEVSSVVNSVWKGNYTQAMPALQKIWTQASLTDAQKNLLGTTFDKYAPGWRDSAAKLQQGSDLLKKFTK